MLTELTADFKTAATCYPGGATTAMQLWGLSLGEILKNVIDKGLELGREHRADIEQAAKIAVDALVALDLPYIPRVDRGSH